MINNFRKWFSDNWIVVFFLLLVAAALTVAYTVEKRVDSVKQACFRIGMISIEQNGGYYCARIDQLVAVDIK